MGHILAYPSDQGLQRRSSACAVFFSPREETILGGTTARAFTEQASHTVQACIDNPVARHETGAVDLSQLAVCVAETGMTAEGQDYGLPRAVIAVPHGAAPGRNAPDGHILTVNFYVREEGIRIPFLRLFALPPALPRQR